MTSRETLGEALDSWVRGSQGWEEIVENAARKWLVLLPDEDGRHDLTRVEQITQLLWDAFYDDDGSGYVSEEDMDTWRDVMKVAAAVLAAITEDTEQ